jgi:hypothetical protein
MVRKPPKTETGSKDRKYSTQKYGLNHAVDKKNVNETNRCNQQSKRKFGTTNQPGKTPVSENVAKLD